MSGGQGLAVDGPDNVRGQVVASRTRDLRWYVRERPWDTPDADAPALTRLEGVLVLHRIRVGARQFQVFLEAAVPDVADYERAVLALIDADPALVEQVEVQ